MERNEANVATLRNHACIIVWSLGNEAGYGKNFEDCYDLVKQMDCTRPVQYERAGQDGKTDIFCPMYFDLKRCEEYSLSNNPRPLIQCEYAHAMGNSMGGFAEYWQLIRKYPKYQGGYIWDFADQGLRDKSPMTGREIFTYGGDYGRYPASDYNFNCNGIVSPDRRLNPHAHEVGYYYQNAWVECEADSIWRVYNENFFVSLDNLELHWTIGGVSRGRTFGHSGIIDITGIAPQQRMDICDEKLIKTIARAKAHHQSDELLLTFTFLTKEDQGLIDKGQVVARCQFVLQDYAFPQLSTIAAPVAVEETKSYIKLSSGGTSITVGKRSGMIDYLDVDGRPMLLDREGVEPDFWRAPTDNDYGARLQEEFAVWHHPAMKVETVTLEGNVVKSVVSIKEAHARLTLRYTLSQQGEVIVTQRLAAESGVEVGGMFRYGMQLTLPCRFSHLRYYGRGPVENYADRHSSQFLGLYSARVDDEYFPYIRPQESGNHTDVRTFAVTDDSGVGLLFESNEPMECSALPYTTDQLDDGAVKEKKWGRHSGDLVKKGLTQIHLQKRQFGLGCINSWGAWPLEQYRLPYQDYTFTYRITPIRAN